MYLIGSKKEKLYSTSKPLKDFIYECNQGKDVFFAKDETEDIKILNVV